MFSQNYPTKNYYILNFLTKTSYSNFFQVVQTPYLLRSFLTEFHQIIKHQNANLKETAIQNNATKGRKRQKKFLHFAGILRAVRETFELFCGEYDSNYGILE